MFDNSHTMVLFTILLCAVIDTSTGRTIGPISNSAIVGKLSEKYYPLTDDDVKVAGDATLILDHFRSQMDKGVYPVPSLDPYHRAALKPIVFDGTNSPFIGTLKLYNATITGFKEHSLDLIETRLKTSRLDFNMSIPSLSIEVDYDMNFVDTKLPVKDSGHIRILLKNIRVIGAATTDKKNATKERKLHVPVGLSLDLNIKECDIFITSRKATQQPMDFIENIEDIIIQSITEEVMEQLKEILYLLPG